MIYIVSTNVIAGIVPNMDLANSHRRRLSWPSRRYFTPEVGK